MNDADSLTSHVSQPMIYAPGGNAHVEARQFRIGHDWLDARIGDIHHPRRLLEVQMRDEAQGVRLPGHDGDFVGNDGEIVLRRGGGATVDEQHLIRADEWILHQEIAAVVGGDLDHANFHERALDGLSLFIQHET